MPTNTRPLARVGHLLFYPLSFLPQSPRPSAFHRTASDLELNCAV